MKSSGNSNRLPEPWADGEAAVPDFRVLVENSSVFFARVTPDAHFIFVSPGCEEVSGWSATELVGLDMRELARPDDTAEVRAAHSQALAADGVQAAVLRMRCKDGSYRWLESTAHPLRDPHGEVSEFHVVFRDVSVRVQAERQLIQHARQQEAVARLGQFALREHDLSRLMEEVLATVMSTLEVQLCGVLKLREAEPLLDVVAFEGNYAGPRTLPLDNSQAGYAVQTRGPVVSNDLVGETRFTANSLLAAGIVSGMNALIEGEERPFGVIAVHSTEPRHFSPDDVNFLVAVANVLSAAVDRHDRERLTRHAALHDPLTGLPNRTLALDRLDLALARRRREGSDVALLMLVLDRFMIINDSLGHEAGDELLLALTARLRDATREQDTVARLGGDEFVVVCERPGGNRRVMALAERIAGAVRRPFPLASGEHFLTASVGIAIAENRDDTAASLLRDADAAMYRAKHSSPGRCELFNAAVRAKVLARLRTETDLRHAIDNDELVLHYQPIIDIHSGRPFATEALVRWQHPHHGLIAPLEFIPIAEETGLIVEVGRRVLEKACVQGAAWQERFETPLAMFVNVSARQLANPRFAADVSKLARRTGLLAGTLGIEVTESVLIEDTGSSASVLESLRSHGLRLLLDDFGTGYSSLSYLRRFPLDGVKVDRSFIDGLGDGPEDAAIMRAIVEMCGALGLTVVAEGVESEAQLKQLRQLGCENVQGFLLCRPMAAPAISDFLEQRLVSALVS